LLPNETRAGRLESGLKLLETVSCPLLIGNIPDASGADKDMLPAEAVPTRAELDTANRRIRQWAASHKNIIVLDLSALMLKATANQALKVHGNKWPAGSTRALLQADGLHPAPAGCSMLTLAALDAICADQKKIPLSAIRWGANDVLRFALASAAQSGKQKPSAHAAN
jgi:lysophospholipase L1-like esterase